jgi:hypothetical protein
MTGRGELSACAGDKVARTEHLLSRLHRHDAGAAGFVFLLIFLVGFR